MLLLGFIMCNSAVYGQAKLQTTLVQWQADTLYFDLYIQASPKSPIYLSFYDLVWKFPASAFKSGPKAFGQLTGSAQFVNFLGEPVNYVSGSKYRIFQREEAVYCLVEVMPNYFESTEEFLQSCIYIGSEPLMHRLGRFYLVGLKEVPKLLDVHIAAKGPRTLIMQFEPKPNFKAIDLEVQQQAASPCLNGLYAFEAYSKHDSIYIQYHTASVKGVKWQLVVSADGVQWQPLINVPNVKGKMTLPKAKWRYVRIQQMGGNQLCLGPVRRL